MTKPTKPNNEWEKEPTETELDNDKERWIDTGRREIISVICNEKRRHTPNSGAGRMLASLLILLGEQEDY